MVFAPEVKRKTLPSVEFTRVLHVPDLRNNLLSVLYLAHVHSIHIHIYDTSMDFSRKGQLLFHAPIDESNTAFLSGSVVPLTQFAGVSAVSTLPLDFSLWHRHLAHYQGVKNLISKKLVTGVTPNSSASNSPLILSVSHVLQASSTGVSFQSQLSIITPLPLPWSTLICMVLFLSSPDLAVPTGLHLLMMPPDSGL